MTIGIGSTGTEAWRFPDGDYGVAVVRLATVSSRGTQSLVWGVLEMIPIEVPVPQSLVDHLPNAPGTTGLTLVYSQTAVSMAEGLYWYSSARDGRLHVPGRPRTVVTCRPFLPEPAWGELLVETSAPFAAPWHDGPRIHRLVPMGEVDPEILRLRGDGPDGRLGRTGADRRAAGLTRSRAWFAERIGFDVLQWDDWLGAIALVAPNPLCRSLLTSIIEHCPTTGAETLLVEAEPRDGADLSTLDVEVVERRVDGWADAVPVALDAYGRGAVALGWRSGSVGLSVRCRIRGPLARREPLPWWRSTEWSFGLVARRLSVAVPSGGRARPATSLEATVYDVERRRIGEDAVEAAETRLARLVQQRDARRGTAVGHELIFARGDRERAVAFIRGKLGRAVERAIVVDPFVEPRDLYEFGIHDRRRGLVTTFLRSSSGLNERVELPDSGIDHLGRHLDMQLRHLREQLGTEAPVVLLMNNIVFHDRLLVVDDEAWVMGHSLNQVGLSEISTMVRLRSPGPLLALVGEALRDARPIDGWVPPPDRHAFVDGLGI